jgi:hypothetical protein
VGLLDSITGRKGQQQGGEVPGLKSSELSFVYLNGAALVSAEQYFAVSAGGCKMNESHRYYRERKYDHHA